MTNFAGSWNVDLATPIGNMAIVFNIDENDGVISGTASSDKETVDFLDTVADGNRLTWTQAVTTPMKLTLKFDVTVEEDAMTGTAKAGPFPASKLKGTRNSAT
jgi:hypothetical protein